MHEPRRGVLAGERRVWPEASGDRQLFCGAEQHLHDGPNRVRSQGPLQGWAPSWLALAEGARLHHLLDGPNTDLTLPPRIYLSS